MATVVAVVGMLTGVGQLVVSIIALRPGGTPIPPGPPVPGEVNEQELRLRRWARQGMLVASVLLLAAAVAFVVAQQNYPANDLGQDAYMRQRGIGEFGRVFAFASLASSVIGLFLWIRTKTWRGELLLALGLVMLSAVLVIVYFDLPVLTTPPPVGSPHQGF